MPSPAQSFEADEVGQHNRPPEIEGVDTSLDVYASGSPPRDGGGSRARPETFPPGTEGADASLAIDASGFPRSRGGGDDRPETVSVPRDGGGGHRSRSTRPVGGAKKFPRTSVRTRSGPENKPSISRNFFKSFRGGTPFHYFIGPAR